MTSPTKSSQNGDPSVRAMVAGVRKIPTAITSPTTSAVSSATPSWRVSVTRGVAVSIMSARKLRLRGQTGKTEVVFTRRSRSLQAGRTIFGSTLHSEPEPW